MKHSKESIQSLLDELGSVKAVAAKLGYSAARYLTIYIQRQGWKIDKKREKVLRIVDREEHE